MESANILPVLSHRSFLSPKPNSTTRIGSSPSLLQPRQRMTYHPIRFNCHKMYVPGFGEASPEAKAAKNLHNFFTYVAVRIVTAQLESYNPEAHEELMEFLGRNTLNDGDKFCADLMRESSGHKSLGNVVDDRDVIKMVNVRSMRILEVRSAYCKNDFEWDNLKKLASKMVDNSNTQLMREYVLETSHVESEN